MRCEECVEKAVDYIEENLKNDISVEDVARFVGYSESHFIGKFREWLGLTPADYLRKRRISEIVRRMEWEKRPICDIAFEYGFNSQENFVRAFKKEHHILPTEFRNAQNSLKLYDRVELGERDFRVEGRLQILEPFCLVVYPCDTETPPRFWNKYNARGWSKRLSGGSVVEDFGVSCRNESDGRLDYYIGIRREEALGDLTGTVTLEIAGGLYAIFETPAASHFHFVNTIHRTWEYIGNVWLPENGFWRVAGYELESYVEESRTYSEKIYIPVTKADNE